jgi:hypothetical protein
MFSAAVFAREHKVANMIYTPFLYRLSRSSASLDSLSHSLYAFGRHAAELCSQARLMSTSTTDEKNESGGDANSDKTTGVHCRPLFLVVHSKIDVASDCWCFW